MEYLRVSKYSLSKSFVYLKGTSEASSLRKQHDQRKISILSYRQRREASGAEETENEIERNDN